MKLLKCPKCKTYSLKENCEKCSSKTKDAHYKFIKLRDESEIHPNTQP